MTALQPPDFDRQMALAVSRLWGVQLFFGILFLILAFVILSYDADSLATVSILIGVSFCFTGVTWIAVGALRDDEMRWWFVAGGVLGLIAGIVAFAYPGETLKVLGLILGWFLLVTGILDVIVALTNRDRDLWWLGLLTGIVMFGLGAWAVREDERSVILLVTIVGVFCLFRGIAMIVDAFRLRTLKRETA
jgi:uncharacterized membrane protein HdeD (DUF308 family)